MEEENIVCFHWIKFSNDKSSSLPSKQFASAVDKVEAIKAKYQVSLEELERLYGSLRAFNGELDLSRVVVE